MSNKAVVSAPADVHWSIAMPNTLAGLHQGMTGLAAWLKHQGIDRETEDRACLVFEEVVTNVIRYAFPDSRARIIGAAAEIGGDDLTLSFDDDGRQFDPTVGPARTPAPSLTETSVGGRGLMLIHKAARKMDYERTSDGHNRLTVTLSLSAR